FTSSPPRASSTLSLHDALPIYHVRVRGRPKPDPDRRARDHRDRHGGKGNPAKAGSHVSFGSHGRFGDRKSRVVSGFSRIARLQADRKSTRLNSSHVAISYAVFC